nr:MAG TPA_asm: hypothetical protein [Inoviridae sp.]
MSRVRAPGGALTSTDFRGYLGGWCFFCILIFKSDTML